MGMGRREQKEWWDQSTTLSSSQSVTQSWMGWRWKGESEKSGGINQPLNQSIIHPINQSFFQSFTQSIIHSIDHSLNRSLIQRSFTQSIIHLIDHSLNPSFNQPIIHSINRSLNHSNRLSCRNSHRVNKQSVFSRRKMKESPELPSRTWTPNAALYKPGPSP